MSDKITLPAEDDGFFEIKIGDAEPIRLDLFECNAGLFTLQQKHPDRATVEYAKELRELVESWGVPSVSSKRAVAITDGLMVAIDAKKADGESGESPSKSADSPSSTGSQPSDSTAEQS